MTEPASERVRVRREPSRGAYDRVTIDAILDEGWVCHLGFVHEGHPYVIPTLYARVGDRLYLHGSRASRALRAASDGSVCVTVTLVDGIVLARSAFNHSANYRSVVVLGRARAIEEPDRKAAILRRFTDALVPGRAEDARPASERELRATTVLELSLDEASAKVRSGPPHDDPEDLHRGTWAGVVPLRTVAAEPVADEHVADGVSVPEYLREYVAARSVSRPPAG